MNPTFHFRIIVLCLFSLSVNGQNWSVFNGNYRYNYKYNNSQLVSQVLFADSTKSSANDTIYYLNRICITCTGSCPTSTYTGPMTPTTTIGVCDMPQFLQKKIKKYAGGLIMMMDTAKLVVDPACVPSQTWLFDSINNKNAVCINKTAQTVFGVGDSVKLIILGGTDTLKLSKNFGLIQFPDLYNKNKYFRLVGIEKAASYDSVALFGEVVPNAWHVFNFDAGDKFCYTHHNWYKKFNSETCSNENMTIIKKAIINGGYSYEVNGQVVSYGCNGFSSNPIAAPYSYSVVNFFNLSSPSYQANNMYPGQLVTIANFPVIIRHFAAYGLDASGTFYKYAGSACNSTSNTSFPFKTPVFNPFWSSGSVGGVAYGVGVGQVALSYIHAPPFSGSGEEHTHCATCALKKGNLYFGVETFVGLKENYMSHMDGMKIYPSPTQDKINLVIENIPVNELRISNLLGQPLVLINRDLRNEHLELSISEQPPGIYLVQLYNNSQLLTTQKILKQ